MKENALLSRPPETIILPKKTQSALPWEGGGAPKALGEALLPGGDLTPADDPSCDKAPEETQGSRFWVGRLLLIVSGISLTSL